MAKPTLTVTSDFTREFTEIVNRFKNDNVLVGIPDDEERKKNPTARKKEVITNAALLAINNFGSPLNNIPPRPVMDIGIRNAQDPIAEQYKKAVQETLQRGIPALDQYYERAGIIASNSIKKAINDQEGFDPPF